MFEDGDFGKYPKGLNILIFSRGHLLYCSWVCFGNSRLLTLPGELTPSVVISSQNIVDVRPSAAISPLSSWSISMKLSGYIFGMAKIMHKKFFQDRERRFFFDAPKRGFSVKRIEVLQFLS